MNHDEWAKSHYGIFCVSPLASLEEICRARDDKLKTVHHGVIKDAFSTLTDDVSRETYNKRIGLGDKMEMLRFAFYHYYASIFKLLGEMEFRRTVGDLGHDKIRHYQNQINELKVPDITQLLEQEKTELSVHEKACIYQDNLSKLCSVDLGTLLKSKGLDVPELQHQKVNLLMTHAGYKWTNDKVTR